MCQICIKIMSNNRPNSRSFYLTRFWHIVKTELFVLLWYIKFVSNIMSRWYHALFTCVKSMSNPFPVNSFLHCFDISNWCQILCPDDIPHLCQKYVKLFWWMFSINKYTLDQICVKYYAALPLCQKYVESISYACSSCYISNLCQTCLPNATLCQKYVKSSHCKIKFVSNVESRLTLFPCVKSMSISFLPCTLRLCQKYVKSILWKTFILHCYDISNLCQIWCQEFTSFVSKVC